MSNRIVLTLGLALAAGIATATAASAAPAQSVRISYADLNLTHAAGVAALYSRLRHAASAVCNPSDTIDSRAAISYRDCAARALDEAVAAVNEPKLTAVHMRSRSG